jgi:hypothetical protein
MRKLAHRISFAIALLSGACFATPAFAIEIENDASGSWANNPDCVAHPALCEPLIIGAPRLVTDMSDNAALLLFMLDFDEVAVSDFLGPSYIGLNIFTANGDAYLIAGQQLQLRYEIPLSGDNPPPGVGLLPATDFTKSLGDFTNSSEPGHDFGLLPTGDFLFTVTLLLHLDLPYGQTFGPNSTLDRAATLTVSGPGTVVSVPEPSVLLLSLIGLASLALGGPYLRRRIETR